MTRRRPHVEFYAAIYVIGVLIGLLTGCAQSPTLRLAQMNKTLGEVELQMARAAVDGRMSREDVLLADPAVQAARAAVDDAELRLMDGEAFKADERMFWAIAKRLGDLYLPPAPTTQPTP